MADINGVNSLLAKMQELSAQASINVKPNVNESTQNSFANTFKDYIKDLSQTQQTTSKLQEDFIMGKPGVSLPEVMVSMQKSSLQTQFLVETRNNVIDAYNQIMNMTV